MKKCVLCNSKIKEEHGKLKGSVVKARGVKGFNEYIHVCSHCQKNDDWRNDALIKGA